jgi:hypothetical protein
MTPSILFRLSPGVIVSAVTWDSTTGTNLVFLGCFGNSVQFRTTGATVLSNGVVLPVGTVLYIPANQVLAVGL